MENTSKRLIFSLSMCVWQLPLADAAIWAQHRWLLGGSHKNCPVKTQSLFALLGSATSQVEFVPLLPLTPGLILMRKYFSFANNVAQLRSARLNMHGGKEQLSWRCRSIAVVFVPARCSITADPQHMRRAAWMCLILLCSACGAWVSARGYRQVHTVVCENSDTSFSHPSFSHYIH